MCRAVGLWALPPDTSVTTAREPLVLAARAIAFPLPTLMLWAAAAPRALC